MLIKVNDSKRLKVKKTTKIKAVLATVSRKFGSRMQSETRKPINSHIFIIKQKR